MLCCCRAALLGCPSLRLDPFATDAATRRTRNDDLIAQQAELCHGRALSILPGYIFQHQASHDVDVRLARSSRSAEQACSGFGGHPVEDDPGSLVVVSSGSGGRASNLRGIRRRRPKTGGRQKYLQACDLSRRTSLCNAQLFRGVWRSGERDYAEL